MSINLSIKSVSPSNDTYAGIREIHGTTLLNTGW